MRSRFFVLGSTVAFALACGGVASPAVSSSSSDVAAAPAPAPAPPPVAVEPLLGWKVGDDVGFGAVTESSPARVVVRGQGLVDRFLFQDVRNRMGELGWAPRACLQPPPRTNGCLRFEEGDQAIEATFVNGRGGHETTLAPAPPYAPVPIPPGAPWDDLAATTSPFTVEATCEPFALDVGVSATWRPDGTVVGDVAEEDADDGEAHHFAGRWSISGTELVVDGTWTPPVEEEAEPCAWHSDGIPQEDCSATRTVGEDHGKLDLSRVWRRGDRVWIDTRLGVRTCGGARATVVGVFDAGGDADAMAAVGQIVARTLEPQHPDLVAVHDAGAAARARDGIEVLYPRGVPDDRVFELMTTLSRDLPGTAVTSREWPDMQDRYAIAVGAGTHVPDRSPGE